MDQTADEIKHHIDAERERLGEDLSEIETRVKEATDWKTYYDKNPGLILGAVAGGGLLLALLMRKANRAPSAVRDFKPSESRNLRQPSSTSSELHRITETADNILGALVGMASSKLASFVADAVPGFRERYDEIERKVVLHDKTLTERLGGEAKAL